VIGSDIKNSVINHKLKEHGIERLKIIDVSIFPNITSRNTNAPTIMVAEKGSVVNFRNAS